MADQFKKQTAKDWSFAISYGDGWNATGLGHSTKRTQGRKKIKRSARNKLKTQLRNCTNEELA